MSDEPTAGDIFSQADIDAEPGEQHPTDPDLVRASPEEEARVLAEHAAAVAVEPSTEEPFDLDESDEERTRRLARERQAAKRARDAVENERKADGRLVRIAARTHDDRALVRVFTATGQFGFEARIDPESPTPNMGEVKRALRLIEAEYPSTFRADVLVETLTALSPGDELLLPGGIEYRDAQEAEQAESARLADERAAQAAHDSLSPERQRENAEHQARMRRLHGESWGS